MSESLIHIEVLQKRNSYSKASEVKSLVSNWIQSNGELDSIIKQLDERNNCFVIIDKLPQLLSTNIESISVSLSPEPPEMTSIDNGLECGLKHMNKINIKAENQLHYYIYQLNYESIADEEMENSEECLPSAQHTILPSNALHLLWESLVFEKSIRDQLLSFVLTSLTFAEKRVSDKLINWNKVVLLHGPPGTGKTSLCRALAQKLSIRLKDKYKSSQLIEINSHSLFSKWFSESGKLVMKLFEKIKECVEYGDQLIFVLIDEVESLAHTRQVSMNGSEPSDAIRVVNALLTQIDCIKNYPNVVILTTSNVTNAIDLAFVDRADIKQYIGLPSLEAIYEIYRSSIQELVKSSIVSCDESILAYNQLRGSSQLGSTFSSTFAGNYKLMEISKQSLTLSGRSLRKIPFLAIALFSNGQTPIKFSDFLQYMSKAVTKQFKDKEELNSK